MPGKATAAFEAAGAPAGDGRYRVAPEAMATIVIFGVTGDLAGRKLIPAIYNLWEAGYFPRKMTVVGVARKEKTDDEFRQEMCEALKQHSRSGHGDDDTCRPFVGNLFYHRYDFMKDKDLDGLRQRLEALEQKRGMPGNRLFYLSTAPEFFAKLADDLGRAGLVRERDSTPWSRLVIEKPFGHDLASACELNARLRAVLDESQIYRIDHYLGKETVQNIFAFRFGNAIFEPLFNRRYVDHVQITVAETVGMEGRRGPFYEKIGALRDVVQNHALQLMCLAAMEPPAVYTSRETRDEKRKVLRSVIVPDDQPPERWAVRGQYAGDGDAPGYLGEEGVKEGSITETYAALKLGIENWRWAGVPFFIRTGKRLKKRLTEIAIRFVQPPTHFFRELGVDMPHANMLVFRIQPDEAISLSFGAKPPGMAFQVRPVTMDFTYGTTFTGGLPEAYERLLLDAIRGDSTLFMREDEIEAAWSIITRVMNAWGDAPPPAQYAPGSDGPAEADRLFDCCEGEWRPL